MFNPFKFVIGKIDRLLSESDRNYTELIALRGELAIVSARLRASDRKLCFVWGEATCKCYEWIGGAADIIEGAERGREKIVTMTVSAEPRYMGQGDRDSIRIPAQMNMEDVTLRVPEPFVIVDCIVGRDSTFASCDNAVREVRVKKVPAGHVVTLWVTWPEDRSQC